MAEAQLKTAEGELAYDEFAGLLEKNFKVRTAEARSAVESAVKTLAAQALEQTSLVHGDVIETVKGIIAELDRKLSAQVNQILHHPEFQQLESAWRGLHHLVNNTETDEMLRIRVFNVRKDELARTLRRYKGTNWDQSPIFKKVYEAEYGQFGGAPYGCMVGDFQFDHSAPDVELLGEMAKIGAAAHCPFITGASPSLLQLESWQELANPRDINNIFSTPEHAAWRSLRQSDEAQYLGLAMPRFLARLPYGQKTNPVEGFDFEEDTGSGEHGLYSWANAAYAMATNITRSFKLYGWCTQIRGIESGGAVEGLPVHTFPTDDGGVDMKCPTEIAITDRREAELAKAGLMPLIHKKGTDFAAFIGAQSLRQPKVWDNPEANANEQLGARLPYLFSVCRFAHYLKCIARDKVGTFKERADMQSWLNNWIMQYVVANPADVDDEIKAQRPLSWAEVIVESDDENPGYYNAKFHLRPHYQLEGLNVTLSLVSNLKAKQ